MAKKIKIVPRPARSVVTRSVSRALGNSGASMRFFNSFIALRRDRQLDTRALQLRNVRPARRFSINVAPEAPAAPANVPQNNSMRVINRRLSASDAANGNIAVNFDRNFVRRMENIAANNGNQGENSGASNPQSNSANNSTGDDRDDQIDAESIASLASTESGLFDFFEHNSEQENDTASDGSLNEEWPFGLNENVVEHANGGDGSEINAGEDGDNVGTIGNDVNNRVNDGDENALDASGRMDCADSIASLASTESGLFDSLENNSGQKNDTPNDTSLDMEWSLGSNENVVEHTNGGDGIENDGGKDGDIVDANANDVNEQVDVGDENALDTSDNDINKENEASQVRRRFLSLPFPFNVKGRRPSTGYRKEKLERINEE